MDSKSTYNLPSADMLQRRVLHIPRRSITLDIETPDHLDPLWRQVQQDEVPDRKWKVQVGTFIALQLGKDVSNAWHIDNWPSGFSLWEKRRPGSPTRKDYYLYGYGGKTRFSSPQQFSFHAVWLYDDDRYLNTRCECTFCIQQKQGKVKDKRPKTSSRVSPPRTTGRPTQKQLIVELPSPPTIPDRRFLWVVGKDGRLSRNGARFVETEVTPERDEDLARFRAFRVGELVWASIPPLIREGDSPLDVGEMIEFWPALVQNLQPDSGKGSVATGLEREYLLKMLGVGHTHLVKESSIVSWQTIELPKVIRRRIRYPAMPVDVTAEFAELNRFHPMPPQTPNPCDLPRTFENALGPLGIAHTQARFIAEQYTLTDEHTDPLEPGVKLYQGAWFGPERIWAHDLVRLACTRATLVEDGLSEPLLNHSTGADERGLFLQIFEMFFVSRLPTVTGCLYELAAESACNSDPGPRDPTLSSETRSTSTYSLPDPPSGFHFRLITMPGTHIRLAFEKVAGRYDPLPTCSEPHGALLSHTLNHGLAAHRQAALDRVLSIGGLAAGFRNVVPASNWVRSRERGLGEAEIQAKAAYWAKLNGAR